MISQVHFSLKPALSDIEHLFRMVEAFGEANGLPEPKIYVVNLMIDELVTNVATHGAEGHDSVQTDIVLRVGNEGITLTVEDNGTPFDPTAAQAPDVKAALEDRPIGKLGLHFVNTLADDVAYRLNDGRNHLTVRLQTGETAATQE